jgi:N4-(beta-N-acetylglucosaminyl)-L-asparaginase
VGAGQYTDNDIGAAGSTGRGESNIMVCGGFLTVEQMRRGEKPTDACLGTLKRVLAQTPPRLRFPDGRPRFDLKFYAVNKRGEFGAASMYPAQNAAHDSREAALRDAAFLFQRPSSHWREQGRASARSRRRRTSMYPGGRATSHICPDCPTTGR